MKKTEQNQEDFNLVLKSERLILRPFTPAVAADVQRLAGDRAIADTTERIPHPYETGMAEAWIATHAPRFANRQALEMAVVLKNTNQLIGAVALTLAMAHRRGVLGYWIGLPFWGQGYATEAARAMLNYGFHELGLQRIQAQHLSRNPASGKVMQKLGMKHEGHLRAHVLKWGVSEDVDVYGILRDDQ